MSNNIGFARAGNALGQIFSGVKPQGNPALAMTDAARIAILMGKARYQRAQEVARENYVAIQVAAGGNENAARRLISDVMAGVNVGRAQAGYGDQKRQAAFSEAQTRLRNGTISPYEFQQEAALINKRNVQPLIDVQDHTILNRWESPQDSGAIPAPISPLAQAFTKASTNEKIAQTVAANALTRRRGIKVGSSSKGGSEFSNSESTRLKNSEYIRLYEGEFGTGIKKAPDAPSYQAFVNSISPGSYPKWPTYHRRPDGEYKDNNGNTRFWYHHTWNKHPKGNQ